MNFTTMPAIKPVEDPEMYTYRWNLSFKHVRPSKTVMDPLSTSSNKKCIDMFMGFEDAMRSGFHDHPSHGPTHRGSPYHPPSKTQGSLWFTYVLNDLDANIQKLANVNNINTKRVGSISDIGKWVFERYLGSRYTIPEKDSFCLILRRYSTFT
jgi:hypothetical protein